MWISHSDPVLAVHDLDVSASWYCDVLGCELEEVDPGNWRFCRAGDVTFMLGRCPDVPTAGEIGDHSYVAYLHVDEVDGYHRRAVAAGAQVLKAQETSLGGCVSSGFDHPTVIDSCSRSGLARPSLRYPCRCGEGSTECPGSGSANAALLPCKVPRTRHGLATGGHHQLKSADPRQQWRAPGLVRVALRPSRRNPQVAQFSTGAVVHFSFPETGAVFGSC
jgi:predicted enzyme related to lactoylglutathione lyase